MRYAGFWWRLAAALIDIALITAVCFAIAELAPGIFFVPADGRSSSVFFSIILADMLSFISGSAIPASSPGEYYLDLLKLSIAWVYFAGMESSRFQATPGKLLVGLKVTDQVGAPIGFWRATGRHFGKFLSSLTCAIGFFMILFTEKRQGFHDLMARCLVLDVKPWPNRSRRRSQTESLGSDGLGPAPRAVRPVAAPKSPDLPKHVPKPIWRFPSFLRRHKRD